MLAGTNNARMKDLREDEKWCIFMRYRHEEQAIKLIGKLYDEEKGIMRAEKAISKIDRDYWKYAWKMAAEKNRLDRGQMIYNLKQEARAEGLAEGRAEGLEKGKVEGREEGRVEGHAEGRVEGHAEGQHEERQRLLEMLNWGLPIEEIKRRLEE
jgi:flagellar biosynthesis/type III secretory pathway protein FliH